MEPSKTDLETVGNNQLVLIEKLQDEILKEPANAYTPHKVDALREATVALINLSMVKRNLETL